MASRGTAYQQAVTPNDPLRAYRCDGGAAGISLRPLAPDDVRAYLRCEAASRAAARWDPVLAWPGHQRPVFPGIDNPAYWSAWPAPSTTPALGEHTGGLPDPAELCNMTRFPTPATVQEHLFDGFIPAAYRPTPPRAPLPLYRAEQAERWLVFLARYLQHDRQRTTDFAWWELLSPYRSLLGLLGGLVFGLGAGFVVWLALELVVVVVLGLVIWLGLGAGLVSGLV